MISNVDRFPTKSTAELRDIGDSNVVQCPKQKLVE